MFEGIGSARANVNTCAQPLIDELVTQADRYRVGVSRLTCGTTIVDAGIARPGGLAAGRLIAAICMGEIGRASCRERVSLVV